MSNFDLQINEKNKQDLLIAAKWAKFLAIIGYVGMGFFVLIGFILLVGGSAMGLKSSTLTSGLPFGLISIFYFVIAALYYFPVTYMYRMAKNFKEAVTNHNQSSLDIGFSNLAKHYKFVGVMVLIIISLYALVFAFGLLALIVAKLG